MSSVETNRSCRTCWRIGQKYYLLHNFAINQSNVGRQGKKHSFPKPQSSRLFRNPSFLPNLSLPASHVLEPDSHITLS